MLTETYRLLSRVGLPLQPAPGAAIAPLPRFVTSARPATYQPIHWKKFRLDRFAGDYADLGEELQISHYKV